ncbi:MAG: glycosyltransferase family 2 protein [Congregibacter sp.]
MQKPVTVVITPRDRYSQLEKCVSDLYAHTDENLFDLIVLDLGYPKADLQMAIDYLQGRSNYRVIDYGMIIPMDAMRRVRDEICTDYAVFMDNDSRVLSDWLAPLLETAEATGAAVISPVVLEASGVDEGDDIRTHLFSTELRVLDVEDEAFLIEHKTFRRSLPDDLPKEPTETQAFELHCVMFRNDALQELELPSMTIREHLDIGMQLRAKGLKLIVEPRSRVLFDNLGTRARLSDLRFFNLRWNGQITEKSSRLFEQRWGYKFYSEEAIYLWADRRRAFLILRWLHIPVFFANKIDRVFSYLRRKIVPVWDPVSDPEGKSSSFYARCPDATPKQLNHAVQ